MSYFHRYRRSCFGTVFLVLWWVFRSANIEAAHPAKVYVILWFDTEDFILPASDDAALRIANFLNREHIRGTFKVVGEKARTLERRGRTDVINALKNHEIGYHANYHSIPPSPAQYLANLGWDEGIAEFERREGPGRDDVERIFGTRPTCYGQPGSSWAPQSYGAMRKWGMGVYLDSGNHIGLNDRPCYYCGILNLYKLAYVLRADLKDPVRLRETENRFLEAHRQLLAEGGGIVSIYYHPCEFIHRQFWDGVNFSNGANPPREQWKLPPTLTQEESKNAYQIFKDYIHFIGKFPDVQFITASEAARLFRDKAPEKRFTREDLKAIAGAVKSEVTFQNHQGYALSASEIFALLNHSFVQSNSTHNIGEVKLSGKPYGPSQGAPISTASFFIDWSQFVKTAQDVDDFLIHYGRIPSTVWLGSTGVSPEAYLLALAKATEALAGDSELPKCIRIDPARLAVGDQVAQDGPDLWKWVIFPHGFRAPQLMELAKRQAWTLKPAYLDQTAR